MTGNLKADGDINTMLSTKAAARLSLIFLGFVVLGLALPLLQTVHRAVPIDVASLQERRKPGPFPSLGLLLSADGHFAGALNAWFDDRVGFRDLFVRSKDQIDYSLFNTSRQVFIGRDGWLFPRKLPFDLENSSPEQLATIERSFVQLAERLHQRGIRLLVIGYPSKIQVYPEMAPPDAPLALDGGNFWKLREFLTREPSLTFVDAEALLNQEKLRTSDRLFAKHDVHPTDVGQIAVVKAVVAEMARLDGRADFSWPDFQVQHASFGDDWGGNARALALLTPQTEPDYPFVITPYDIGKAEPDGEWTVPGHITLERADDGVGRPFDWEFRSNPDLCPQRLPGTVLFGNSFSDLYWHLGFHRYFCFIRRTRDPMSRFKLFYETIPSGTKYMIYEFVAFRPMAIPPDAYE